jgi:dipeptidyl aminopeptidase/acylaminoacyl peptidase
VGETRVLHLPRYTVAFASVARLNTDIFIAVADGSDAKPLLAHPELDYNASFSLDGRSIVFTSTRNGSADLYCVGLDGANLQRLTDDPAFDDRGVFSPDARSLAFVSSRCGQAGASGCVGTTQVHVTQTERRRRVTGIIITAIAPFADVRGLPPVLPTARDGCAGMPRSHRPLPAASGHGCESHESPLSRPG